MATIAEQLPAFHYFQVGNGYTGNMGAWKYKIMTSKADKKMTAHIYSGPLCFELTEKQEKILHTAEFELTPEGFEGCKEWLAEKISEKMGL